MNNLYRRFSTTLFVLTAILALIAGGKALADGYVKEGLITLVIEIALIGLFIAYYKNYLAKK